MSLISRHMWYMIIVFFFKEGCCSNGDNSPFYNNCVKNCTAELCVAGKQSDVYYNFMGIGFSLWSCLENCEYDCQWQTVEAFQSRNWPIPQFKGKWPFIRLFGFQEPASVFFSILNFFAILKLLHLYRKNVSKSSPYYYVWNIHGVVQLHSWLWSSVYHSRDIDFTERMDYMSAFLVVLFSCYAMGLRYLNNSFNIKNLFWTVFCVSLGLNHLTYLWLYKIDYGYNMKLNCTVGGICVLGWILWSFFHFQSQPYVWKIFVFSLLVILTSLLELWDFPPVFWLIDAHALWHCSSIIPSIFLYLFIIDDCNYLTDFEGEGLLLRHKKK